MYRPLTPAKILLLTKALGWLVAYRVALWVVPFRWLVGHAPRPNPRPATYPETYPAEVAHAITALSHRLPLGFTCLVQALAARRLLRAWPQVRLSLGVQKNAAGAFAAHAWLTVAGQTLLGGQTAHTFQPITEWT